MSVDRDVRTDSEAHRLLSANRRIRAVRRWLFIGLAPFALAAILFSAKLLSMYGFAYQSISSFIAGDYAGSTRAAQGQDFANWFEKRKAPFNVGVGLAASGDLEGAEERFTQALDWASGVQECDIRVNLALVLEWQGDAARRDGLGAASVEFYGRALEVNVEAPEECNDPSADDESSDSQRSMNDTLEEQRQRLQEKQEQSDPPPEQGESQGDDEQQKPKPDDSALDELQDRLEQGEQERQEHDRGDGESGWGTDKPW
ncbi:hypothetical protein [Microbacterium sp. YY-01]|uniref:hypothetical protein n=1 Tax=Microbacterium sp. YY-01 TaxID=3421634 RepID=UPI003D1758C5